MKPLLRFYLMLLCISGKTALAQLVPAGFDASQRPMTQLEKAEAENWKELTDLREIYSSTYEGPNGLRTSYQSKEPVNYRDEKGQLTPIDIRCTPNAYGWSSDKRPDRIAVSKQGEAHINSQDGFSLGFSRTRSINGQSAMNYGHSSAERSSTIQFTEIVPGVNKQFHFRYSGLKYDYVIAQEPTISNTHYIIQEEIEVPEGYVLKTFEGKAAADGWKGNLVIENIKDKKIYGKIHPLLCYDAGNEITEGSYRIAAGAKGKYILELLVPAAWMNDPARQYPVVIDPLVTGPTTTYPFAYIPSCFFPAYNVDSINVNVPAGITVTALNITCSFYADPFTTTLMADGRMYFSTSCGQSTVFQVAPPAGSTAGTAYLDNYNILSPLMCCHPQSCSAYTFWLRYHLSRTTNGPACSTTYLYYDPFGTAWPFSAYIQGYTPETYATEMVFVPATICANTCTVEARVFAKYGVPPFTFTHPWTSDTLVGGIAIGCGGGNHMKALTLTIPSCPNYCDPSTTLAVPPPVVIDACGAVVTGYDPSYTLNIKPVPTVSFSTDTIKVCSDEAFTASVSSCLPGGSITWSGNGNSGTTLVNDTLVNTGTGMQSTMYTASVILAGCTGVGDTLIVQSWPPVVADFEVPSENVMPGETVNLVNQSQLNGNTLAGWIWTFEDSTFQLTTNAVQTHSDTGTYTVCLTAVTLLGCNDTTCKTYIVLDVELELPNIITPNGDGLNDILHIKALEFYPENTLLVFNRWGNKVYEKQNYANDWKAPGLSDGTYYYFLKVPNKPDMSSVLQVQK